MRIGRYELKPTLVAIFRDFIRDGVPNQSAAVAYHTLFSFIPLLLFLTAMVGVVSRAIGINSVMDDLTDWLFNRSGLPPSAAETLRGPIESIVTNQAEGVLGLGALFALWGAKNAVSAMMRALNVAFDVPEGRPWWLKTAISIGLTITIGLGILLVSFALLLGGSVGGAIAEWLGLGSQFAGVWGIVRWILAPVMVVLGLAVLYWAGPNVKAPFKWLTPGAVVSVILFGVVTWGLGIYFQFAGGYVTAYGVLGGFMAFVFWLYVMAMVALLGACINSVLLNFAGETHPVRYEPEPGSVPNEQAAPTPAPDPDESEDGSPASPPAPGTSTTTPAPTPVRAPVRAPVVATSNEAKPRGIMQALGIAATAAGSAAVIKRIARRTEQAEFPSEP